MNGFKSILRKEEIMRFSMTMNCWGAAKSAPTVPTPMMKNIEGKECGKIQLGTSTPTEAFKSVARSRALFNLDTTTLVRA